MKTGKNRPKRPDRLRLLVLVPHRDTRLLLRAWSAALFAAGLPGAWSFPWAAPLASLKRPLSREELQRLARALRHCVNGNGGKLTAGPPASCALPACSGGKETSVFGPSLPIDLPNDFFTTIDAAIDHRIAPLVIGSAIMPIPHFPAPPQISFRAAALANMSYCSLQGDYSFEWKIGKLRWMPRSNR